MIFKPFLFHPFQPKKHNKKRRRFFLRSENLLHPGAVVVADNVLKPGASVPRGGNYEDDSTQLLAGQADFKFHMTTVLGLKKSRSF